MAVSAIQIEELAGWCLKAAGLADERASAWRQFFAEDDPRVVAYWPGAEEFVSRQRRFLGWFLFHYRLADGRSSGQAAAEALFSGDARKQVMAAVRSTRYVLAIVRSVLPPRSVFLEMEKERFEVRSRALAQTLAREDAVVVHLVPSRPGAWLAGPGWVQWPVRIGPNLRNNLKSFQADPLSVERMLQGRSRHENTASPPPRDADLKSAVERMSRTAKESGSEALAMDEDGWVEFVLKFLPSDNVGGFCQEITDKLGGVRDVEEANRWLSLAMNIWNNVPQPDRGGKSATELASASPLQPELTQDRWMFNA